MVAEGSDRVRESGMNLEVKQWNYYGINGKKVAMI
jgi:hypothetical protein